MKVPSAKEMIVWIQSLYAFNRRVPKSISQNFIAYDHRPLHGTEHSIKENAVFKNIGIEICSTAFKILFPKSGATVLVPPLKKKKLVSSLQPMWIHQLGDLQSDLEIWISKYGTHTFRNWAQTTF